MRIDLARAAAIDHSTRGVSPPLESLPMKLSRCTRALSAWLLYCSLLFSAFACSTGHAQLMNLQLSAMNGAYCSLDSGASGAALPSGDDWGRLIPSPGPGCLLCTTFPALMLAAFFGLLGRLPRRRPIRPRPSAEPAGAVRYLWPSANPRASPQPA
jgi:hypothetical protein